MGRDNEFGLRWERGRCFHDPEQTTGFKPRRDGHDLLLTEQDGDTICDWVLERLRRLARGDRRNEPAARAGTGRSEPKEH